MLAVVAVIAVLVAAFLHLWRTNEGFREAIIGTWEKIRSTISTFVEGIKERLNALGFSFSDIAAFIRTVWDGLCQFLGPVFIGAFNAIATQLQMILGVITGIFDIFSGLFTGNWTLVWQGVSEIFSSIWEGMKGLFEIALNTIKGIAEVILSWFGTTWNEAWTAIKEFFTGLWDALDIHKHLECHQGDSIICDHGHQDNHHKCVECHQRVHQLYTEQYQKYRKQCMEQYQDYDHNHH